MSVLTTRFLLLLSPLFLQATGSCAVSALLLGYFRPTQSLGTAGITHISRNYGAGWLSFNSPAMPRPTGAWGLPCLDVTWATERYLQRPGSLARQDWQELSKVTTLSCSRLCSRLTDLGWCTKFMLGEWIRHIQRKDGATRASQVALSCPSCKCLCCLKQKARPQLELPCSSCKF